VAQTQEMGLHSLGAARHALKTRPKSAHDFAIAIKNQFRGKKNFFFGFFAKIPRNLARTSWSKPEFRTKRAKIRRILSEIVPAAPALAPGPDGVLGLSSASFLGRPRFFRAPGVVRIILRSPCVHTQRRTSVE
jgi:hypothetical protein